MILIRKTGEIIKKFLSKYGKHIKRIFIVLLIVTAIVTGIWLFKSALERVHNNKVLKERGEVSVVVFGDSIWDIVRDDTGIAARLQRQLGNKVILSNCAIMGTSAAMRTSEAKNYKLWNEQSLYSMVQIAAGLKESAIPEDKAAAELMNTVDFQKADYFVIAYGLNDYFSAIPRASDDPEDVYTYAGALRSSVKLIKKCFPNAKIIIMSQTYCQQYSYGRIISDSNDKDFGGGTGLEYIQVAKAVADEMGTLFINNSEDLGINIYNGKMYLSDATHLTAAGRLKYANNLADYLIKAFEEDMK